jgi:hypothetical protein
MAAPYRARVGSHRHRFVIGPGTVAVMIGLTMGCSSRTNDRMPGLSDTSRVTTSTPSSDRTSSAMTDGRSRWRTVRLIDRMRWAESVVGALGSWWQISELAAGEKELQRLRLDLDADARSRGLRVPEPEPGRIVSVEVELEARYDTLMTRGRRSRDDARHVARAAIDAIHAWLINTSASTVEDRQRSDQIARELIAIRENLPR